MTEHYIMLWVYSISQAIFLGLSVSCLINHDVSGSRFCVMMVLIIGLYLKLEEKKDD